MSHKKKYNSLNELPFFNFNKSYVKMDAAQALFVLEQSIRSQNDNKLGPAEYSALCSLRKIIKTQQSNIDKLLKSIEEES